jgi:hypothetical protein
MRSNIVAVVLVLVMGLTAGTLFGQRCGTCSDISGCAGECGQYKSDQTTDNSCSPWCVIRMCANTSQPNCNSAQGCVDCVGGKFAKYCQSTNPEYCPCGPCQP